MTCGTTEKVERKTWSMNLEKDSKILTTDTAVLVTSMELI